MPLVLTSTPFALERRTIVYGTSSRPRVTVLTARIVSPGPAVVGKLAVQDLVNELALPHFQSLRSDASLLNWVPAMTGIWAGKRARVWSVWILERGEGGTTHP